MDRPLRTCDSRPSASWKQLCCIAAALVFATAGGGLLAVSSELLNDSGLRAQRQRLVKTLPDENAGVFGAGTASGGAGAPYTTRGMQDLVVEESWDNGTLVSLSIPFRINKYPALK